MGAEREIYEATVTSVDDPEQRGRLRCTCQGLLAEDAELPDWVEPCFALAGDGYGLFLLPRPGDLIEIEVTIGHSLDTWGAEAILAGGLQARWRCGLFASASEVPADFTGSDYGRKLGLVTPGGLAMILNDETSEMLLKFGTLKLGENAAQHLLFGDLVCTLLSSVIGSLLTHFHPLVTPPGGPTGPPDAASLAVWTASQATCNLAPGVPSSLRSAKVTTE